jgi:membrane-bound ClpP family serine protease
MNFSIRATLVLLALAISSAAQNPLAEPLPKPPIGLSGKEVVVVNVTNGLAKSNAEEALEIIEELDVARTEAVIIQIHCLMDTNWEEINLIMGGLGNLKIPSYAFVDSMAVDAGALLSFATDKIYMAPASIIGGSPILGSGNMKAKLASFNLPTTGRSHLE